MITRTYTELIKLPTFEERLDYLNLNGVPFDNTFAYKRYLNQKFYTGREWRTFRRDIIIRDNGCDLGIDGYEIWDKRGIIIHHINPIRVEDLINHNLDCVMNPENVICVSLATHNAIHYGDVDQYQLSVSPVERTRNDTCPWKTGGVNL